MRNFSDKYCRKNQNTHICSIRFFSQNIAIYETAWKNVVEPERPQMTIQYGACAFYAR
jgi:hypothetical protein